MRVVWTLMQSTMISIQQVYGRAFARKRSGCQRQGVNCFKIKGTFKHIQAQTGRSASMFQNVHLLRNINVTYINPYLIDGFSKFFKNPETVPRVSSGTGTLKPCQTRLWFQIIKQLLILMVCLHILIFRFDGYLYFVLLAICKETWFKWEKPSHIS